MQIMLKWFYNAPKEQEKQSRDAKLHELGTPTHPYAERPAGEPQYCGEAAVDIIAVHGLDSDPETGWSRKLPDGTRYPWLRKRLLGDMPDARILSFSYPSSFYGDPTYTSIEECAKQLLREIIKDRRHPGRIFMCPTRKQRPIVFLGHSFGGLVIKQALLTANEYITDRTLRATKEGLRERRNYQDILSAVGGILFFGTPHKGSPFSHWAVAKMWLGSFCGQATYPALIRLLRTHSLELHDMNRDFKRLCRGDKLAQTLLFCYYEMKGVPLYPYIVVDQRSACISDGESRGFKLTHKDLNKFKAEDDPNYDQMLTDLTYAVDFSAQRIAKTFTPGNYRTTGASESSKAVELALKPANGQLDQLRMKLSHRRHTPDSCMWILDHADFKRWVSHTEDMDAFWIYGKGGAGKSVLAAYIIDWLRSDFGKLTGTNFDSRGFPVCRMDKNRSPCGYVRRTNTVLFFFFGVNRSNQHVVSFLGTLAHQLLSIHYDNERLAAKAKVFVDERVRNPIKLEDEEGELINLLVDMLTLLGGPAYIVVDGVEENDEGDQGIACLRALSKLKRQLSSPLDSKPNVPDSAEAKSDPTVRLQIMVVSQATSSMLFEMQEHLPKLKEIDISHYTQGDIASFVMTKSDKLLRRKPKLEAGQDTIIKSLLNRAQGMFEMVNTGIKLLEKYAGDVKDIDKWLDNLPPTLLLTWEKVFMRLPAGNEAMDAQRRIRLALKLLAVCARPLSATELYYAYTIGTIDSEKEPDGTAKTMDGEVKRLLRGWAQFKDTKSAIEEIRDLLDSLVAFDVRNGTVELVHDSVRKALLLPDDLQDRYPQNSGNETLRLAGYQFTEREAQETAATLCMRIIQSSTLSHATAFAVSPIPFVEYSWDQWKYHLRRCSAEPSIILDQMIRGVSRDTIAFLGALTEFVARDIPPVGGRYSDLEYIICLKRARECLLPAIEPLTTILKGGEDELSKSLVEYRKVFATAKDSVVPHTAYAKCEEFVIKGYRKVRSRFMPKGTLTRLRIDALLEKQLYRQCPKMSGGAASLLEAARNLRTVAVRFAVNPVYTALISRAGGKAFSPVHPLVYAASLLEECGSAPFWDQLSSNWDPVDPFICNDDDPQAGSARFVLQCFVWRQLQDQVPASAESNRQYLRAVSRVQAQPNPDGRQLLRVSTANREQVKRLQGMSGSQFITSYTVLGFFGGEAGWAKTFIYNPIGQHHLRSNLLLNENGSYLDTIFEDPTRTLARHAPVMEAPVKEALDAIPGTLRIWFVKYVALLFELFGNVASSAIAIHTQEMIRVAQGLQGTLLHINFLWETASLASFGHIIMATLLFVLRILYFPSLGAHALDNPWRRLCLAVNEPTQYLQSQHNFSWWYWAKALSSTTIFETLKSYLATLGTAIHPFFHKLRIDYPGSSPYAYLSEHTLIGFMTFIHLCGLQRYMISVLYLLATIVAGGYVMMRDQSSMHSILIFTVWYWYHSVLGILNQILIAAFLTAFGPWGILVVFLSFVPQYYATKLLLRHQLAVAWVFSWPFQPLIWAGKLAWISFLHAYVHWLRIIGIGVLCGSVFLALHWFRQHALDPYDIEGSVRQLRKAANLARLTLKEAERRHIGEYPLGGEIEDSQEQPTPENGSTRALPTSTDNPPNSLPAPEPTSEKMIGQPAISKWFTAEIEQSFDEIRRKYSLEKSLHMSPAARPMDGHIPPQAYSQPDSFTQESRKSLPTSTQRPQYIPPLRPPSKSYLPPPPKAKVLPFPPPPPPLLLRGMELGPSDNTTTNTPSSIVEALNTTGANAGNSRELVNPLPLPLPPPISVDKEIDDDCFLSGFIDTPRVRKGDGVRRRFQRPFEISDQ